MGVKGAEGEREGIAGSKLVERAKECCNIIIYIRTNNVPVGAPWHQFDETLRAANCACKEEKRVDPHKSVFIGIIHFDVPPLSSAARTAKDWDRTVTLSYSLIKEFCEVWLAAEENSDNSRSLSTVKVQGGVANARHCAVVT